MLASGEHGFKYSSLCPNYGINDLNSGWRKEVLQRARNCPICLVQMWAEQKQAEVDPAEAQQVEKSVWGSVGKAMSRQSNAKYSKSQQDLKREVPQLKQCRSLSLGWWVTPPVLMVQSQSLEGSSLSSALCSALNTDAHWCIHLKDASHWVHKHI